MISEFKSSQDYTETVSKPRIIVIIINNNNKKKNNNNGHVLSGSCVLLGDH